MKVGLPASNARLVVLNLAQGNEWSPSSNKLEWAVKTGIKKRNWRLTHPTLWLWVKTLVPLDLVPNKAGKKGMLILPQVVPYVLTHTQTNTNKHTVRRQNPCEWNAHATWLVASPKAFVAFLVKWQVREPHHIWWHFEHRRGDNPIWHSACQGLWTEPSDRHLQGCRKQATAKKKAGEKAKKMPGPGWFNGLVEWKTHRNHGLYTQI